MKTITAEMDVYWQQLDCGFPRVMEVFADCMQAALETLSCKGVEAYIDYARFLGKMGRGAEPILIFLEVWPDIAQTLGEDALPAISECIRRMYKSPNGGAIVPFLQALPTVARRMPSKAQMNDFLQLVLDFMERTTGSIHGIHQTFPSPGLPAFFKQIPLLLSQLSLLGLTHWVEYGVNFYNDHPDRQVEYFSLQSPDSRAVLQRERQGTLLSDNERRLDLYLRGLWQAEELLIPYSNREDEVSTPYYDALGIRLPDVYKDFHEISGLNRYRALLAHIMAHKRWSNAIFGDNLSPLQRMAAEFFEDSRVEYLSIQEYPGMRRIFMALHPVPVEEACDTKTESCIRHRLTMLSRALLDVNHPYQNKDIIEFVARFHAIMQQGECSTQQMADLAISFVARTRRQSDQLPKMYFTDTVVDYRDDNRHLWRFMEQSDDEEMFDQHRKSASSEEIKGLPPRHYPEWDYNSQSYRPDWVSLYESLHPMGRAADIDALLEKHAALAKRLKKMLELLKPQDKVRIRYQEDGSELDLDVALRSLIDFKGGSAPDPRINMSHKNNGRNIAVMVLLDLSESLNNKAAGSDQTLLQLSQEAVSLLAWAVQQLGDPFAIAGFHSNTRHDVRYMHIKGYGEQWGDEVKGRLAAMEAGYSTRMGAAMRHAAHYLDKQVADKKLMLILTDGEPADIDSKDGRILIEDARKVVTELDSQGIYAYCINLDPKADDYVKDIFGRQYTIIDKVSQLPEKLPALFISLTK
jgi:hypothetical protein